MSAKYTRLSTEESDPGVAFDFSSYSTYAGSSRFDEQYKSIFSYGDEQIKDKNLSLSVVKEPMLSRLCRFFITALCVLLCIATFPVSAFFVIKTVSECERLVIFRLGRLQKVRGPGVNLVLPCIDRVKKVDVRIKAFNVPPLQLITSDAGIIELGADVYYKISDAVKSVTNIQDVNSALRGLVRNAVMSSLTKHNLQDIDEKKNTLLDKIQTDCNQAAVTWGVCIERIQLSPIKVLQAAQEQGALKGLGGQQGLSQVFQQLAQALLGPGTSPGGPVPTSQSQVTIEMGDGSGAAGTGSEEAVSTSTVTPATLVDLVRGVLSESLVLSVDAVYQFELSGSSGGVFYLDLKHGKGSVGVGPDPGHNPDVTLGLSVSDMQSMFTGNLKPLSAYMSGRLLVSGDLSAATRLEEVMERVISKTTNSTVAGHTVVNI
ncbi:stomatin-like protein 1 [Dreissena polymorpha]|nr:stomatin-like protein 1 [Dreissena polymorpha]XP_052241959.1 stomatin-like protein 1 [Dreissena polymorpha]XP_052241960.1 stomatin-like protein 1 [Dreissena polymorpha]